MADRPELAFSFAFRPPLSLVSALVGVTPGSAGVEVDEDELRVDFGPWHIRTPLANVVEATVTGPYFWPKVVGPPHVSLADRGLTMATNAARGVCIRFREPVRGSEPTGLMRHPALTVTVETPEVLAELLDRRHHEDRGGPRRAQVVTVDDLEQEVEDELHALTAAELRARARRRGLTGVSSMNKAALIEALTSTNGS